MGRANALPTRWGPAKPKTRIKVQCGEGRWEESDHRLDIPHERIERFFQQCCSDRSMIATFNERQVEHRIAAWICQPACSFVLFDTKSRATVIRFEREDDASGFREAFCHSGV